MNYLNVKTPEGVETIDQINRGDFNTTREYKRKKREKEQDYLRVTNYFTNIYWSRRPCKGWLTA